MKAHLLLLTSALGLVSCGSGPVAEREDSRSGEIQAPQPPASPVPGYALAVRCLYLAQVARTDARAAGELGPEEVERIAISARTAAYAAAPSEGKGPMDVQSEVNFMSEMTLAELGYPGLAGFTPEERAQVERQAEAARQRIYPQFASELQSACAILLESGR